MTGHAPDSEVPSQQLRISCITWGAKGRFSKDGLAQVGMLLP